MGELFAEVNGEQVRVIPRGAQVVLADLSESDSPPVGRDAGGRARVSQITTLGDYKILNADRPLLIKTVGNGSGTFSGNTYNMRVESGQYLIRYSRIFHPYFAGKSQIVEDTFDKFGLEFGVIKRVGYFSSSPTGTYSTMYDGFWVESNGVSGTYYLKSERYGTPTVTVPWTEWDAYEEIKDYNWNNFTVNLYDFIWLGGATLNLYFKVGKRFLLAHAVNYAGTAQNVFIQSPNQPLRYEIRGVSGGGDFRYICGQVGTEGSIEESGVSRSVDTGITGTTCGAIGTIYPIKGIRKLSTRRDIAVAIEEQSIFLTSTNDRVHWTLLLNPVLSAPATWTELVGDGVEHASGNGIITVLSPGYELAGGYISTESVMPSGILKRNFLAYLGSDISNNMDEIWICAQPITANCTVYGTLAFKEY